MPSFSLDDVLSSPDLPTLPAVAIEILKLMRDQNAHLNEIAKLVENDPALSAKILSTVNSSFYSLKNPCPSIQRAISYLGLKPVRALVLGFSLVDMTRGGRYRQFLTEYWQRSVYSAAIARRLAESVPGCDPDHVFLAALMQDVGMLAMSTAMESHYDWVLSLTRGDHRRLPEVERATVGFSHTETGARLAQQWRLPEELIEPIRGHHATVPTEAESDPLVDVVRLAYQISAVITGAQDGQMLARIFETGQRVLHLDQPAMAEIIRAAAEDARELSRLLNVDIGAAVEVKAVLAEAERLRAAEPPDEAVA